jgi:hypothetical protein
MCNDRFNPRLAPLNRQHLRDVQARFPQQAAFAAEVYDILTDRLTPQANLLVTFVVLKDLFDRGRAGIFNAFGRVLYAPLSIVAQTGPHEWTRFRPSAVDELHTSFLSFMMAKPNRLALNRLFGRYGLAFSQGHCCGILFGAEADLAAYEASDLFGQRNRMRSYAEAMGMPVVETGFEAVPPANSDLGPVEREFYRLYEETFAHMTEQGRAAHIDPAMRELWEGIVLSAASAPADTERAAA